MTGWRLRGNPEIGCPTHPGGEIKGAGGYIVAPPSPHPDGWTYEWVRR